MDTKLRLPVDSQIVSTATKYKTIICTTGAAEKSKKKHIESFGLQVVTLTGNKSGRVSLIETLEFLAAKGINSVLIEGGGILSTEFLRSDLIDELLVYRAPIILGGDGRAAVEGLGVSDLSAAAAFERTGIASIGTDLTETYKRGK
jgi:diaminohydroxyphosphoribosylaminopyrimidine deaminase/5-amino-6-(5-phosphoribosylamino)uracil reductase